MNIVYTYESIVRPHFASSSVARANVLLPILIINKRSNERTKLALSAVSRADTTQLLGHFDKFTTGSFSGNRFAGSVFTGIVDDRIREMEHLSQGEGG